MQLHGRQSYSPVSGQELSRLQLHFCGIVREHVNARAIRQVGQRALSDTAWAVQQQRHIAATQRRRVHGMTIAANDQDLRRTLKMRDQPDA